MALLHALVVIVETCGQAWSERDTGVGPPNAKTGCVKTPLAWELIQLGAILHGKSDRQRDAPLGLASWAFGFMVTSERRRARYTSMSLGRLVGAPAITRSPRAPTLARCEIFAVD